MARANRRDSYAGLMALGAGLSGMYKFVQDEEQLRLQKLKEQRLEEYQNKQLSLQELAIDNRKNLAEQQMDLQKTQFEARETSAERRHQESMAAINGRLAQAKDSNTQANYQHFTENVVPDVVGRMAGSDNELAPLRRRALEQLVTDPSFVYGTKEERDAALESVNAVFGEGDEQARITADDAERLESGLLQRAKQMGLDDIFRTTEDLGPVMLGMYEFAPDTVAGSGGPPTSNEEARNMELGGLMESRYTGGEGASQADSDAQALLGAAIMGNNRDSVMSTIGAASGPAGGLMGRLLGPNPKDDVIEILEGGDPARLTSAMAKIRDEWPKYRRMFNLPPDATYEETESQLFEVFGRPSRNQESALDFSNMP